MGSLYTIQSKKSILCADPNAMRESLELSEEDMIDTLLTNIAHEYRHHMQFADIVGLQMVDEAILEDDAEDFAMVALRTYKNRKTLCDGEKHVSC